MSRGFGLPMVMGGCVLLFVLFLGFRSGLDHQRHRLTQHKHQQAATWLARSGLDVAHARWRSGELSESGTLVSPNFQHGRFVVTVEKRADGVYLVSRGEAGRQHHTAEERVGAP